MVIANLSEVSEHARISHQNALLREQQAGEDEMAATFYKQFLIELRLIEWNLNEIKLDLRKEDEQLQLADMGYIPYPELQIRHVDPTLIAFGKVQ
jgi:hypothetical protein